MSGTTDQGGARQAHRTGDADVDSALEPLSELADEPLRAHVARFDAVHTALQARLAEAEGGAR